MTGIKTREFPWLFGKPGEYIEERVGGGAGREGSGGGSGGSGVRRSEGVGASGNANGKNRTNGNHQKVNPEF